jgi:hypothetical protein
MVEIRNDLYKKLFRLDYAQIMSFWSVNLQSESQILVHVTSILSSVEFWREKTESLSNQTQNKQIDYDPSERCPNLCYLKAFTLNGGVTIGSERYITIHEAIARAARLNNIDMMDYFYIMGGAALSVLTISVENNYEKMFQFIIDRKYVSLKEALKSCVDHKNVKFTSLLLTNYGKNIDMFDLILNFKRVLSYDNDDMIKIFINIIDHYKLMENLIENTENDILELLFMRDEIDTDKLLFEALRLNRNKMAKFIIDNNPLIHDKAITYADQFDNKGIINYVYKCKHSKNWFFN